MWLVRLQSGETPAINNHLGCGVQALGAPPGWGSLPSYIKAAARPDFQLFFLFFSLDQKVYPELPRPSLVSHGDELPDLIYEVALCRVIFLERKSPTSLFHG